MIVRVPATEVDPVIDVLCEAFADYPVMRHVVGDVGADYPTRLQMLIRFFVMARAYREEPMFGIPDRTSGDLAAAATVSFPTRQREPMPAFHELREATWLALGGEARARYDACGDVWRRLGVDVPHLHVHMIGVRRAHQGRGFARRLLEHVHQLSRDTPDAQGITLSTEDPENVPFYQHMGYAIVGTARIAHDLETWSMFKPNE